MTTPVLERTNRSIDIKTLLGRRADTTKTLFEPVRSNSTTTARIRIPEHQRFYVWVLQQQQQLINTILSNYPMPTFVFTDEFVDGKQIRYVQDGQQRLTTIQKYILGDFSCNDKYYAQLSEDERSTFLDYQLSCEIITNPTDEQIAEIFERLNAGKPLTDNDKFWNRRNSPMVSFVFDELIVNPNMREYFETYVGPIGKGKSRSKMSDIMGATVAIAKKSTHLIRTSFSWIGVHLCGPVTNEMKSSITQVFSEYFKIIRDSMAKHGIAKPKKIYGKLSGMLGIYLYWKLKATSGSADDIDSWIWYAAKCQDKSWTKDYFTSLSSGAQRNVDESALRQRTEYLLENSFIDVCQQDACDMYDDSDSSDDDM
jgi:hypothetical protein